MRTGIRALLALVLAVVTLYTAAPAQAVSTAIGVFYADCARFSVDVAVTGTTDDGGGFDKFRYVVLDGSGKVLYLEDASRRVGVTAGSLVINFNYTGGQPAANPIRFQVQDLDGNNNVTAVLKEQSYDAKCRPASGTASSNRDFRPPNFLFATILTTTPLYSGPGRDRLSLNVEAGKVHIAVYRSLDSQWIAIDVGGNDLVWVPVTAVQVELARLGPPPTRIDLANPAIPTAPGVPGGTIPSPTGVTALTTVLLRFRTLPTTASEIIDRIPPDTEVPVLGSSFNRRWIKVIYNGVPGWVSASFVLLSSGTVRQLPVVE